MVIHGCIDGYSCLIIYTVQIITWLVQCGKSLKQQCRSMAFQAVFVEIEGEKMLRSLIT